MSTGEILDELARLVDRPNSLKCLEAKSGEELVDPMEAEEVSDIDANLHDFRLTSSAFYWRSEPGSKRFVKVGNFIMRGVGFTEHHFVVELREDSDPLLVPFSALDSIESLLDRLNAHTELKCWCTNNDAGATLCAVTRRDCKRRPLVETERVGTVTNTLGEKVFALSSLVQWDRKSGRRLKWKESGILLTKPRLHALPSIADDPRSGLKDLHDWVDRAWGGINHTQILGLFGYGCMVLNRSVLRPADKVYHAIDFPCCWIHSQEGGSGKSSASLMLLALFGAGEVVKDLSIASLYETIDQLRDCVVVVDDKQVDPASGRQQQKSGGAKALYALAHNLFDSTSRKTRASTHSVQCGVVFCTNFDPPEKGTPQHRRLLILPFHKAARPTVGESEIIRLQEIQDRLPAALGPLLFKIKPDPTEIQRIQDQYVNGEARIVDECKAWYAQWLYFTMCYARLVLNMQEDEVWARFCTDVLGAGPVRRALAAWRANDGHDNPIDALRACDGVFVWDKSDADISKYRAIAVTHGQQHVVDGFTLHSLLLRHVGVWGEYYQFIEQPSAQQQQQQQNVYIAFYTRKHDGPAVHQASSQAPERMHITKAFDNVSLVDCTADGTLIQLTVVMIDGKRYCFQAQLGSKAATFKEKLGKRKAEDLGLVDICTCSLAAAQGALGNDEKNVVGSTSRPTLLWLDDSKLMDYEVVVPTATGKE